MFVVLCWFLQRLLLIVPSSSWGRDSQEVEVEERHRTVHRSEEEAKQSEGMMA
jgi:hypothetical protein